MPPSVRCRSVPAWIRAPAPIDVQPALDAPAVADRPRLEDRHVHPGACGRATDGRLAAGAARPEPGHQVVALDHQVLDDQLRVGHGRQPAGKLLARGVDADRRVGRVLDHAGGQELIQVAQLAVVDAVDEAAVQGADVIHRPPALGGSAPPASVSSSHPPWRPSLPDVTAGSVGQGTPPKRMCSECGPARTARPGTLTGTLTETVAYAWKRAPRPTGPARSAAETTVRGVDNMDGHTTTGFGERLRHFRLQAGLSQAALAERANLSLAAVATLERGVRSLPYPRTVEALAAALGLSATERADLVAAARPTARLRRPRSVPNQTGVPVPQLPVWLTSFVGREAEVEAIRARLGPRPSPVRLLTLTGPGGVGKTRLAVAAATALAPAYPDGVVFVDLAPLRDARLVPAAIGRAAGVRESAGRSARELLLAALRERRLLLVLDNCEHLLAAAPQVAELVQRCPRLAVLATSRAALRVQFEQRVAVAPLATAGDPVADGTTTEAIAASPAVQLFVARAQAVAPDFALTDAHVATVASICRRLDGIPLAIELAAARVSLLSPEALLRRLERRLGSPARGPSDPHALYPGRVGVLPMLTGGARDLPGRQRTLAATLAWSHDLLGSREKVLFRHLSVFAGGWTVAAVEAVCADADLPAGELLDRLQVLVDSSLIQVRRHADATGEPRFGMLETIREYALEQLVVSGELRSVAERHAAWYTALVERAPTDLVGPGAAGWYEQFEAEIDNLWSALGWALQDRTTDQAALRLATALARFWYTRGRFEEVRAALEAVTSRGDTAPSPTWVQALTLFGQLEAFRGEFDRAAELGRESLRQAEALGEATWITYAQQHLGITLGLRGDVTGARSLLEGAVTAARRADDRRQIALALVYLAVYGWHEASAARQRLEQAVALSRDAWDAPISSLALGFLALLELGEGRHAHARALVDEASSVAGNVGFHDGLVLTQIVQGGLARAQGAYDQAGALYRSSLRLLWQEGHLTATVMLLEHVAGLEAEVGDPDLAAQLVGAVDAFCAARGVKLPQFWRLWWAAEPAGIRARARAGEQPFATAWSEGQTMRLDDAVLLVASSPPFVSDDRGSEGAGTEQREAEAAGGRARPRSGRARSVAGE